ncbi:hypothetical protein [Paenibacillus sp. FSL R7-0337]|uniref:hypothetical protein n=1 Tax=Paenibacillus sp. FSL R7-0337 TaxID=1926588 RepID=UPI00096D0353|nr:hypothetical protein [Paenibacillus sp. FSL R7-0337]OMF94232.1 hypothetical protein BK147_16970 [Paenibacillus sp. FSL R7-0337]
MQQQVDVSRMLELEQGMKRLNRILEEQVTGMDRNVGGLVRSVQAAYPESYVQSPSREAIRLLQELGREAQSLSDRLERKQSALSWAAGQYQSAESKAQSLLKSTPAFNWKQAGSLFSRWLQGIRDRAARGVQDVLRHPPTLSRMIQDLLRNVRDASVDRQLQAFAADAVISELFQQRESGSPAEQQQAREQLSKIAEALREIGRSQAAYSVYEKYGNKAYMKSANEHAESQRELLQKLGVDPGFYVNTDLRTQYKGSPLSACTYNPLLTDGSAVPASDELRFVIALGLVNEKYREWAKSNYKDIEAAVVRAEQIRELERQVAEYKRLHGPPMTLPDGTPITAKNKENETTFAYFKDKVYDPSKHSEVVYTAYYGWLEDTYGMTKWRKIVVQADQVTQAFVGGLIKSTVMGAVDTAKFAFDFVIDPEKTTQETIDKVNYLVNHPEVLVDAAKAMYHDFNEGTPEQKAEMLGNAASILVPGVPIAKTGVVGKLADAVMDPLTDAVKKVPDALKNWNFPGMNPYPNRLIPATPGGPGPVEVPGQVWRSEGRGKSDLDIIRKDAPHYYQELMDKYGDKGTYHARTLDEYEDLARDPDHNSNIDDKTRIERQAGLELEVRGELMGPIVRDPVTGRGEFIDGNGQVWDVKGFNSNYPPKKGGFRLDKAMADIEDELRKGENVILDTTKLSKDHIEQLTNAISIMEWKGKIRWWP